MQENVGLSQISAIMLGVRDLPQALAFYQKKLGLTVIMQQPQLALLQCGTVMLGLSRGHVQAAPHVAGATEVVFRAENVRAAHRALTAQGVSFVTEPHQATQTDWVAHFRDANGHLLSIFGRRPGLASRRSYGGCPNCRVMGYSSTLSSLATPSTCGLSAPPTASQVHLSVPRTLRTNRKRYERIGGWQHDRNYTVCRVFQNICASNNS